MTNETKIANSANNDGGEQTTCADCGKLITADEVVLGHSNEPQPIYKDVCYITVDGKRSYSREVVGHTYDQPERGICCQCLNTNYQPCGDCGDMWRKDELVDAVINGKVVKVCPRCARDMMICDKCGRPCDKVDDSGEDWLCALCASDNAETTK